VSLGRDIRQAIAWVLIRIAAALVFFALLIACASCGGGGGGAGAAALGRVHYVYDDTGIFSITLDGRELVEGGLYIIGACNTTDDPRTNVTSRGWPPGVLGSRTDFCPGAPYRLIITQAGEALDLDIEVGPLPAAYTFLSVPLQLHLVATDRWSYPGRSAAYGSALREWRSDGPVPWSAVEHDGITLRRDHVGYSVAGFIANPTPLNHAETVEPRWLTLPRGAILHAHERLTVWENGVEVR